MATSPTARARCRNGRGADALGTLLRVWWFLPSAVLALGEGLSAEPIRIVSEVAAALMAFVPVPYGIDHAALDAGGNFGLALGSGRLVATVVSQKSGKHITVQLRSKVKVKGRFRGCALADAERLFIDVPSQGGSGREIGQLHLAGRWAGKILPPWEEDFDEARVWAAKRVLDVAHGRAEVADDMATIVQGRECIMCGRELTDPESIARDIGPECWKRATGSIKDEHGTHQRPGEQTSFPTETEVIANDKRHADIEKIEVTEDKTFEEAEAVYESRRAAGAADDPVAFATGVVNGSKPTEETREQIEAELQQTVVEEPKPDEDLGFESDTDTQLFLVPADADPREVRA